MIPARKHRGVEKWFRRYTRRYLQAHFHRVLVSGAPPSLDGAPLLVCVNHSSWWDLLLGFWLAADHLGWDAYAPMDERQLARYPILARIGVFGVDRTNLAGGRAFLSYTEALLRDRSRVLWMTAQGGMFSTDVRPVRLYSGIARLAARLPGCRVATVAFDYEFWEERRPEAFVAFGPVLTAAEGGHRLLQRELERELAALLDQLAELRRQRNSALFEERLRSTSGISPAYDALRRLTAWWKSSSYTPDHAALETPPRYGPAAGRRRP